MKNKLLAGVGASSILMFAFIAWMALFTDSKEFQMLFMILIAVLLLIALIYGTIELYKDILKYLNSKQKNHD